MHKLVILFEPQRENLVFQDDWPQFLHLVEQMPGLRREATSLVKRVLYGQYCCEVIHELFFDNLIALEQAMSSKPGREAGEWLQRMSSGKVTLLLAEHKEDELVNIREHRRGKIASKPDAHPR